MWRLPLILGVIGVVILAETKNLHRITTLDVAILIVELAISLAIGSLMGRIAVFRPDGSTPAARAIRSHAAMASGTVAVACSSAPAGRSMTATGS